MPIDPQLADERTPDLSFTAPAFGVAIDAREFSRGLRQASIHLQWPRIRLLFAGHLQRGAHVGASARENCFVPQGESILGRVPEDLLREIASFLLVAK